MAKRSKEESWQCPLVCEMTSGVETTSPCPKRHQQTVQSPSTKIQYDQWPVPSSTRFPVHMATSHTPRLLSPTLSSPPDLASTYISLGAARGPGGTAPASPEQGEKRKPGLTNFFLTKSLSLESAESFSLHFMVYFSDLGGFPCS